MTIKSENPLPRYASGQKSVSDGRTERLRMDRQCQNNIPPEICWQGIIKIYPIATYALTIKKDWKYVQNMTQL